MFYQYIKDAGFLWMMPIIFLSFCALAFCLERSWYWLVYFIKSRGRVNRLQQFFQMPFDRNKAARMLAQSADVVLMTLHKFLANYENATLAIAERQTRMFAEEQVEDSRSFLDLLSLIASISGTLGLMGTVIGISISFKSLASEDSKQMARSLSTALYTTIGGIILFLLSYLFWFFLQKLSERMETALDVNIQKLKDILETEEKSKMIFDGPPQTEKTTAKVSVAVDCRNDNDGKAAKAPLKNCKVRQGGKS